MNQPKFLYSFAYGLAFMVVSIGSLFVATYLFGELNFLFLIGWLVILGGWIVGLLILASQRLKWMMKNMEFLEEVPPQADYGLQIKPLGGEDDV